MSKRVDHPIILGIVGDSASGKTTLSAGVAQILGAEHCTVMCTDDYHRYNRRNALPQGLSALDPRANYLDVLEQHLRRLREGEPILKPVYDHRDGTLRIGRNTSSPRSSSSPRACSATPRARMRDCYDVKIYLDPEEDLRVKWKIHRDTTKRGYTPGRGARSARGGGRTPSQAYIHPQRTFADIVIRFQKPQDANGSDTQLDVRHILRPTLPHPDFTPLFDGSSNAGLHLELARDRDGKPVDVLEINGNISDQQGRADRRSAMEPDPGGGAPARPGRAIDVANGSARKSHPLR